MKKQLFVLINIVILITAMTAVNALTLVLNAPSNNTQTAASKQEFMFSFDQTATISNCTLFINDRAVKTMNTLIKQQNNIITGELDEGEMNWYLQCFDSSGTGVISDTRKLTMTTTTVNKEGYDIIYNNNKLRSYVITLFPGQLPVILPEMKAGEDIRIIISQKTYYLDLLKMGSSTETNFVEVRDRFTSKTHRLLVNDKLSLDYDGDGKAELELVLKDVQRNVNAYFVVMPYPGMNSETPQEEEAPATEEETAIEQPETTTEPVEEEITPEQPAAEPIVTTDEEDIKVTETTKPKISSPLIIIGLVVVLAIIIMLVLLPKNKQKHKKDDKERKQAKKEKEPEEESKKVEKFEIIKSTGKRK